MSSNVTGEAPDDAALGHAAERGALWTLLGQGGSQMLRLISNLILTRMLPVEAFGVMLLVQVFIVGLEMLSDVGIGPAIIQSKRHNDRRFLDTAWTLQVLRGSGLWAVAMLGAVPFAMFYGQDELMYLLPVMGLVAMMNGLYSSKQTTQQRDLQIGRLIGIEISTQAIGFVVTVGWAIASPTVWALVAGWLAKTFATMVASHVVLPGPNNRLRWDRDAVQEVLGFGRWIALSSAMGFIAREADVFIFGKLVSVEDLGVYSRALVVVTIPLTIMSRLTGGLLFPLYSRVVASGEASSESYQRVRMPLMVLGGWIVAGLCGGGQTIVALIYPDSYADAGWMLQILMGGVWFGMVLEAMNTSVLLAHGQARWVAITGASKLVFLALFLPLGFWLADFPGAVAGVAVAEAFRYFLSMYAVSTVGCRALGQDLRLGAMVAAGAAGGWLGHLLGQKLAVPTLLEALFVFAGTTLIWLPSILPLVRKRLAGESLFGL